MSVADYCLFKLFNLTWRLLQQTEIYSYIQCNGSNLLLILINQYQPTPPHIKFSLLFPNNMNTLAGSGAIKLQSLLIKVSLFFYIYFIFKRLTCISQMSPWKLYSLKHRLFFFFHGGDSRLTWRDRDLFLALNNFFTVSQFRLISLRDPTVLCLQAEVLSKQCHRRRQQLGRQMSQWVWVRWPDVGLWTHQLHIVWVQVCHAGVRSGLGTAGWRLGCKSRFQFLALHEIIWDFWVRVISEEAYKFLLRLVRQKLVWQIPTSWNRHSICIKSCKTK